MSTAALIQKMQREIDELNFKYRELEVKYKELENDYACACLDLDSTRKELLRATS